MYSGQRRIDFDTEVDWQQQQMLLKVAFPVDIRATQATYEIQFGNIKRPTHWNTSWDYAKFESCAHRWADLSEGDYGVALLNDSKYGYDIRDNTMRLTLIKSSIYPDPKADQGHHQFCYSLYPHLGDEYGGEVAREGYELNYPLWVMNAKQNRGKLPPEYSFLKVNANNVILETVKMAEDEDCLVLRFYESGNRRSIVKVTTGFSVAKVRECNLMEEDIVCDLDCNDFFAFEIRPYEIKTFKVWPQKS